MVVNFKGFAARWHGLVLACIAGISLAGCSRADAPPECSFFSNVCNPTFDSFAPVAVASVSPRRLTAQVGASVAFRVGTSGVDNPMFQWRRSADGGRSYFDVVGATGTTYTLAGVNLGDDGAVFEVDVHNGSGGVVAQAVASLSVSSMPGVVFQDSEFLPSDWLVSEVANPPQNGPTHSETRATAGGNPDAYRSMVHDMPAGPSSLSVIHASQSASYDPAALGAIYVIDYAEDCIRLNTGASKLVADSSLLIEQGGRRYVAKAASSCTATQWAAMPARTGLGARDFAMLDGPACTTGEACPDFAGNAQPLRFGFVRRTDVPAGSAAASAAHGIDNWKVTVWRH
jgi:hypothetical protein